MVEEELLEKEEEEVDRWRTLFGGKRDLQEEVLEEEGEGEEEGRERVGFLGVHRENTVRPRSPMVVVGGGGVWGRVTGTHRYTLGRGTPGPPLYVVYRCVN